MIEKLMTLSLWVGKKVRKRVRKKCQFQLIWFPLNLVPRGNRVAVILYKYIPYYDQIHLYIFFFYYLLYYDHNIHGWLNICWKSLKISVVVCHFIIFTKTKCLLPVLPSYLSSFYRFPSLCSYLCVYCQWLLLLYSKTSSSPSFGRLVNFFINSKKNVLNFNKYLMHDYWSFIFLIGLM